MASPPSSTGAEAAEAGPPSGHPPEKTLLQAATKDDTTKLQTSKSLSIPSSAIGEEPRHETIAHSTATIAVATENFGAVISLATENIAEETAVPEAELPPHRHVQSVNQAVTVNVNPEQSEPPSDAATSDATVIDPKKDTSLILQSAVDGIPVGTNIGKIQAPTKKSFLDVAKNKRKLADGPMQHLFGNPPTLPGAQIVSQDGKDVVVFEDEATALLAASLKWALVGKFSHDIPTIQVSGQFFLNLGFKGEFELKWLSQRQILIVMTEEEDYVRLWTKGIWNIEGCQMRLMKWTPVYNAKTECSIVPIWVSLPGLPAHLYEKRALHLLASQIGRPVMVDTPTAKRSRANLARICVEIDLLLPLKTNITLSINGLLLEQPILYENVPTYCVHCSHIGHAEDECFVKCVDLKLVYDEQLERKRKDKGKAKMKWVVKEKQGEKKSRADKDKNQVENNGPIVEPLVKDNLANSDSRVLGLVTFNPFQALDIEEGEVVEGRNSEILQEHSAINFAAKSSNSVAAQPTAAAPRTGQLLFQQPFELSTVHQPPSTVIHSTSQSGGSIQAKGRQNIPLKSDSFYRRDVFIPDMDVARMNWQGALDMISAPSQSQAYDSSDDEFDDDYDDEYDEDFKVQALHRGCSTPTNKKSAFNGDFYAGYDGRITRSRAKLF